MNNPNDIVQVKHADSITAAINRAMQFLKENSSGNDFGLFFDNGAVKCFMPTASLSGNIVTCGNDSFTLTGFADLSLRDSKFFDSNNNQVGSLNFNFDRRSYEFNFSLSAAINPDIQNGDLLAVNSSASCLLLLSDNFPTQFRHSLSGYWTEFEEDGDFMTYDHYFSGSTSAFFSPVNEHSFRFVQPYDFHDDIFTSPIPGFAKGLLNGDESTTITGMSFATFFDMTTGKPGYQLSLNDDKIFGDNFQTWLEKYYIADDGVALYIVDQEGNIPDIVGKVVYAGASHATQYTAQSFVYNSSDSSYTFTRENKTVGFYTSDSIDYDNYNNYTLLYRDKATGGDTFTLTGFAEGLSMRDNILLCGSETVGYLTYTTVGSRKPRGTLTINSFNALDIDNLNDGDTLAVALTDNDRAHGGYEFVLAFDSSLTAKKTYDAHFEGSGGTYSFIDEVTLPYIGDYKPEIEGDGTAKTTATYYAKSIPDGFDISGLPSSLGKLSLVKDGARVFSGDTQIGYFLDAFLYLNTDILNSNSVVSLHNHLLNSKFFRLLIDNSSKAFYRCYFNDDGYGNFSFYSSHSTVGFLLIDDYQVSYHPTELHGKDFGISGLRDDISGRLYISSDGNIRTLSAVDGDIIGKIFGTTITLYENALPARQPVTVTATDGNTYSVTPDYHATLSGTDAADFTLVLPR